MKNNWRDSNKSMVNSRRSTVLGLLTVVMLMSMLLLAGCSRGKDKVSHDEYTCPMHPAVIADKPGLCPVCGMDLIRKGHQGEKVEITEDLSKLLKSPNETVVSSIKTIKAEYKHVPVNLEAQGIVTYDTRNIYTIPARVGGRLEKVLLKYIFQPVTKGQKIVEIYSPELITAQRELLYLLENDAQNSELIQSAKNKIILLGASEAQVATLMQRKEVSNTFSVYSPYTGYLVMDGDSAPATSNSSAQSSTPNGDMMSTSPSSSSTANTDQSAQANTLLREGSYVSAGQTLFKVVNPSSLRIELDLPASQGGTVTKGDKLRLDLGDNNNTEAIVDFVQPFFTAGEEFVKLRVYTKKSNALHIGHLVKASLNVQAAESLWLPKEAVLDLGVNQIVFIKEHGVLKPKKITVGTKAESWIEVKQGLTSSDEIAANAQYLVDSESFVKVN